MATDARINVESTTPAETKIASLGGLLTRNGLEELVRTRPLLAFAGAGVFGATLGGVLFPRLGRLMFLAVAGYAANELLHRQRGLDGDDPVGKRAARGTRSTV